jgi:hypothetical protein
MNFRFSIEPSPRSLPRKSGIVNGKSRRFPGTYSSFFASGRLGIRHGCRRQDFRYINDVNHLTKQEQLFLIVVLGLLLTGWAVKTYRAAHPPAAVAVQPVKP